MASSDLIPFLAMVILQVGYAGMNITSKLAMQSGMNPIVLVAYRQIFATIGIGPFAYWIERKTMPRMTTPILLQLFLCSLTGATGNQVLYFLGLKESTATIACALSNILPAFTFIIAVFFRQEIVRIKTKAGQAKVLGTVVSVGGALLLSFYHGSVIGLGESKIHWKLADDDNTQGTSSSSNSPSSILGIFYLIASAISWAVWFTIQASMCKKFPAPYMSSTYVCFFAGIQCVLIALCFEHTPSEWSLANPMKCIAAVYSGVVCSGLALCIMSWTIQKKGPLYTSVFSPLLLVIVAILSWALLREKLYVGTALGSLLIVIGLYGVLWGKNKEMKLEDGTMEETDQEMKDMNIKDVENDEEFQLHMP